MTRVAFGSVFAVLVMLAAQPAAAQLKLPALSPAAKVSQEVGLTDISIEYSSPGVKGRKIWGGLVPWDKPWRTGANASSKITFSRDVTFGGKPVPAGTYAIITLPSQKGWTVILSKELASLAGKPYDAKDDVVRVSGTTATIPARERLTFLFSNTTDSDTSLDLEWEKLRVSVPIKVDTAAHAQANIKAALDSAGRAHSSAASYVAENTKDYATALKYVDTAIAIQPNWYNHWAKAQILAKQGNYPEARKVAQVAWELGLKDENFFFKDAVAKALEDWKNKK
ncbi:MAG: DUF2911 domain-containing protein [Myxococcaceae bacterium]|nr:DUF2911 domain-containing protein [Myxococcaceae bacterium]